MEREGAIGGCSINHGSSGEIEIPPPRPKRRSNHPYPRKEGNSHSTPYRLVEDTDSSPIEVCLLCANAFYIFVNKSKID